MTTLAEKLYNTPSTALDVDMVSQVETILAEAGIVKNIEEAFLNHRLIKEARGKNSMVQRFLLNRYWTFQLGLAGSVTTEERCALLPEGSVNDWLAAFKRTVVPFLLRNDLPRVL